MHPCLGCGNRLRLVEVAARVAILKSPIFKFLDSRTLCYVSAVGPRKCRTQAQVAERESKKAVGAEANVIMSNRQSWALQAGEHKS